MAREAGTDAVLAEIEDTLQEGGVSDVNLHAVLDKTLDRFECVAGTIHLLNPASRRLELRAQKGLPVVVVDQIREIPIGKGMAGLAAERREPVQVCNIQTDESDVAKPGAKKTRVEGAVALPMLVGDSLRGTIGVAKSCEYEFQADETELLLQIGTLIGKHLT